MEFAVALSALILAAFWLAMPGGPPLAVEIAPDHEGALAPEKH